MEEYTYLIYLLLTKKPAQMDALRSEESLAAFRIEAGEWAEREKLGDGQGWEDLKSAAHAVLGETKKAESLEPTPSKGRKKRVGN